MQGHKKFGFGGGLKPDQALIYFAQRLVTHPVARGPIASLIASAVKSRHGGAQGPLDANERRALVELRKTGTTMLAPIASAEALARMKRHFSNSPVIGPDGAPTRLDALPAGTPSANHSMETILACPDVLEIGNDPNVMRIVSNYLGCKPTLSSIGVRWSFPAAAKTIGTQHFHRDIDDWRMLKLFIYLSDVDDEGGPHAYVRTSHKTAFGLKAKIYQREQLERRYGAENLDVVTGPTGTTFMADTLGIHCGLVPTKGTRLMLQYQYSLLPVFGFNYDPIKIDRPVSDTYTNRLMVTQ